MKWGIDQVKIEINDKIKVHYLLPCTKDLFTLNPTITY